MDKGKQLRCVFTLKRGDRRAVIEISILVIGLLILTGCFSAYQSPKVLEPGERRLGAGISFGTENLKTAPGKWTKHYYLFDGSVFYRSSLTDNMDGGIRIIGFPGVNGMVIGDVKYQFLRKPLLVSGTFGLAYWVGNYSDNARGFHRMLMFGSRHAYVGIYWDDFKSYRLRGVTFGSCFSFRGRFRLNPEVSYCYGPKMADTPYYVVFGLGIQYCFPK